MSGLVAHTIEAINSDHCAAFRGQWGLRGYVVVGSTAFLGIGEDGEQDTDIVLLSDAPCNMGVDNTVVLSELTVLLQQHPLVDGVAVWFVQATVNILKLQHGEASLDLLWLQGCAFPPTAEEPVVATIDDAEGASQIAPPSYVAPAGIQFYRATDTSITLPPFGGPSADCIHLSRLFLSTLCSSRTFTVEAVHRVRAFAKRRHVYGSKYGYPGGSAWCTMLWCFCIWLDTAMVHSPESDMVRPPVDEVVWRFLTVLALWPWPLPWTTQNMSCIVDRKQVDGSALSVSIGRHLTTSFVVPLPTVSGNRVWNMTQCVQAANQQVILREAWQAATVRTASFSDVRHELRETCCHRHNAQGGVLLRWPVYLEQGLFHQKGKYPLTSA